MRRAVHLNAACARALTLFLIAGAPRAFAQDAAPSEPPPEHPAGETSPAPEAAAGASEPTAPAEGESTGPTTAPSPSAAAAASTSISIAPAAAPAAQAGAAADALPKDTQQAKPQQEDNPVVTGSHIRRPRLMPDDVLVIDSPLSTDVQGRDYLQTRRQLSGVAMPDTTAALNHSKGGGPGTDLLELRYQPTLILLNGRRLISAPYFRNGGADYVDLNQIPLQLIDRIETTRGVAAGLYGDGAVGGTVNFITRRDYSGVEIEIGGQTTDRFDQSDKDVSLTLGAGSQQTGMNAMVSFFDRQPLKAGDRDWIHQRTDIVESLLGSPASFQQLTNFEYPFPDPFCNLAKNAGYSSSIQARLPGYYGPPSTLGLLPDAERKMLLMNQDVARGNSNGVIDPLETATYCATDFTPTQDLILKDQRIQTYTTFWHQFTKHTEGFGELGYYRSDNQNRTAPSFPIIRLTSDTNHIYPAWVPADHADQPTAEPGFSSVDVATIAAGRVPNYQFVVGRVDGLYAGHNVNKRNVDVFRGVLGVRGDFKDAARGSVLETWDWEVAGNYNRTEARSTVPDVLMDRLADALRACSVNQHDADGNVIKDAMGNPVKSTIKQRQEAGCYNPFYSSVTNNAALDPLHVYKGPPVSSSHGFITTDTDKPGQNGYGVQDGGYICDPNDPSSPPCPDQFTRNNLPELAGTPNTQQVMDRLFGQQITQTHRGLGTVDGKLQGEIVKWNGGGLAFGLGAQYRRETLGIDYDGAYNRKQYAFLFGAPDVPNVGRDIGAGYAELRLRAFDGLAELQPAARIEHYQTVGTAASPLLGLMVRPFAASSAPPKALEWLILRGHIGRGNRAPSLMQMYGSETDFESVKFFGKINFVPHQISGNSNLDFEKYTTISGGLQWDYAGVHLGADFWTTQIGNVIGADNAQTLISDCQAGYNNGKGDCKEQFLLSGSRILDHIESNFDNLAHVSTNGVDGGASFTLDSKRRNLGDFGTFVLGVQGSFLNSYLISSPRALREYYRVGAGTDEALPAYRSNGTRDYSKVSATYEAAGYRNADNFAPPMPRLRFSVPLRWMYLGHVLGLTMRYIGPYNDDSEYTIERLGLSRITPEDLALAEGQRIPAWVVFDANYGYSFETQGLKLRVTLGVINLLDKAPPAVQSPLGYEIGLHDPRGRMLYARINGKF